MHALTDAAHVDHLRPDAGIALATAADGEALTKACFGDRVAWVPWRRPGFQLGLDIAAVKRSNPAAALGTSCRTTSCAPRSARCGRPPPAAGMEEVSERLRELHTAYREDYRAYYERHADEFSPPMRGADPAAVLVPGVGMFSFGADKQTARVAGEFYVNAINVMRGAESVSTYAPISEHEKFRIEYWSLEEAKLRRRPTPRPLATRVALVPSCAEFRPSRHAVRPPPTGREAADGSRERRRLASDRGRGGRSGGVQRAGHGGLRPR